ncbi:hypothetical protein GCG54_00015250 [Colletotrichum gloeosporioides]|uniref:Uncharacterized protein n=1 Tax=Colletotrichum gloeosporioides TaxID=474922 RepID=A0A8H4FE68_COLGL|nr:uncharacterized protein GCG54_00015250 [Colletotrichum gloeosporioides]KAF3798546.1 hypothetical protein GCG54_00015250 [Colletotrichum gloeosporioides]
MIPKVFRPHVQLHDTGTDLLSFFVFSVAESLPHDVVPPADHSLDATDAAIRHPAAAHTELQPEPEYRSEPQLQSKQDASHAVPQMIQLYDVQPMQQADAPPSHQGTFRADSLLLATIAVTNEIPPIPEIPDLHCLSIARASTAHAEHDYDKATDKSRSCIAGQFGYLVEEDVSPTTPRPPQRPHGENIVELVIDRATHFPLYSDNWLFSSTSRSKDAPTPRS